MQACGSGSDRQDRPPYLSPKSMGKGTGGGDESKSVVVSSNKA